MAVRDSSQKVTFIYTNLYKVYKQAKDASPITSDQARVFRPDELAEMPRVKVEPFQPPKLAQVAPEPGSRPGHEERFAPRPSAYEDLRANINKLTDLHSRLRFMLKELEDLVGKK